MKPMRRSVRIHSALICVAVLFSLLMASFGLTKPEHKIFVILMLTAFGEVVLLLPYLYSRMGEAELPRAHTPKV